MTGRRDPYRVQRLGALGFPFRSDLPAQLPKVLGGARPRKMSGARETQDPHAFDALRIRQHLGNGRHQPRHVARRHQASGVPGHFAQRGHVRCDDGGAAAHGLEHRQSKPFQPRRIDEEPRPAVKRDEIVLGHVAEPAHPPRARARVELFDQLPIAPSAPTDDHQIQILPALRQNLIEGRQQGQQILARLDGPDGENVGAGQPVLRADRGDGLLRHRPAGRMRRPRKQHHPLRGDAKALDDVEARCLRHGGDRRGRYHRAPEERPRDRALAPREQLRRAIDGQIVHDRDRRAW